MSEQKNLDSLLKIAVVGLQNSGDFRDVLSEPVRASIAAKQEQNDAQVFLDAAALSFQQAELSRIPAADEFEELPEIPAETLRTLQPPQAMLLDRLLNQNYRQPAVAALHLIQRSGFALPDLVFCELLEQEKVDKKASPVVFAVASARSRWLISMNTRWQTLLGQQSASAPFHQARSHLQIWHLATMDTADIAAFCQEQWKLCNANGRGILLNFLRSYPPENIATWLAENLQDKSDAIVQKLTRWFISCHHPQAETLSHTVAAKLGEYLDASKPRKPDITPPEKLDTALRELAIFELDTYSGDLPLPVQYMAQLLVLSGPKLWAAQLQCDSATAMERLLKTRFGEELERALLEAALLHQDVNALSIWCKKVNLKKVVGGKTLSDYFGLMLLGLGPKLSLYYVEFMLQEKHIAMLIAAKVWQQLVEFRCVLPKARALQFLEQWCQYIVKHRFAFDRDIACCVPLCLDLNTQDLQQSKHWRAVREANKFPSNNLDIFESLIQLNTELQK